MKLYLILLILKTVMWQLSEELCVGFMTGNIDATITVLPGILAGEPLLHCPD